MLLKRIVIEIATKEHPQTEAEGEAMMEELEDVLYSIFFPDLIINQIDGHEVLQGKLTITVSGT